MLTSPSLPIDAVLPELRRALAEGHAAVLQAPPGAGKTTRVPLALLDEPWLAGRSILMLEPRRLAATNAAGFMAAQLGEAVGATVGYAIRYERKAGRATRIEVVTEAILTRRLQSDPELRGVGLVIFDEFHERNLQSDLGLALCRDVQTGLRQELRLLVMSATLDAAPVARLLGDCPLIVSVGRSYPVEVRYLEQEPQGRSEAQVAVAVRRALRETAGDLLAFLPGAGEIRRCAAALADLAGEVDICPLYGDLPFAEQQRAILPGPRRRLVLATNIAETSLTIEGVRTVIDAGWERRPRFDAGRGLSRLELVRISRAGAEQRAGRAGRLGPGVCYRLWSAGQQGALLPFAPPEIRICDLAPLALELARWGVRDPHQLAWLDPPPAGHLAGGRRVLEGLGALDAAGRLTPLGAQMAELPTHPRLARLLLAARQEGVPGLGADLAALLDEREPAGRDQPQSVGDSDLLERLRLLRRPGAEAMARAARQWRRLLGAADTEPAPDPDRIGSLLALAFPDRIGRRRENSGERYLLSNGAGARLSPRAELGAADWLVAVDISGGRGSEGEIRVAARLTRELLEELFGRHLAWQREVEWDEGSGRVLAREVRRLGALALQERPIPATGADLATALLGQVRRRGLELLNWGPAALQWRARVQLLADVCPGWPDLGDAALLAGLEQWLAPYLAGVSGLDGLRRVDLLEALQSRLAWSQRQELERLAPERLPVPSGSAIRLDYLAPGGPVLACKLQELFGLAETPRIAGGRVPVLIHLLSPAGRPLAVTRDLRSFWDQVYPEVKKEMKGRYPKHPWPDDPWSAAATRRTKPRP